VSAAFFYDTWAFVALWNGADAGHAIAAELDERLDPWRAVTSDYVLDETLTFLHADAGARVALAFLGGLEDRIAGGDLLLFEVTPPRRERALATFRKLAPSIPRLSFTDCTSFVLMRELGIRVAFTADAHFRAAGGGVVPAVERKGRDYRSTL